jgi:serine/threonine protein kinase
LIALARDPTSKNGSTHTGHEQTPIKKKTGHILVETWKDLPSDMRRNVVRAGIDVEEATEHFRILLAILRFKTHTDFYLKSDYENRPRVRPRRHNTGVSLVHPDIVSTQDYAAEEASLLDTQYGRKDYRTSHQVGKGGYGKVYLSKSTPDKTNVAIKRVPYVSSKDRRKALQEVRFLRYCGHHPNIVGMHRAHLVKDELWIVMEYLEGATLMQAVAIHKFSEIQIAYIARYMLKAIMFLHENQIAHRDLKSSNVVLTSNGSVQLIDLGLCTDISQGQVTHMVGSPFWMPPEMIRKEPHGLPVDIWSYAICLMEIANGKLPYRKSSMLAMFKAATEGYPEPFESARRWTSSFRDFLSLCLQPDPNLRATAQQLYQHPWLSKRARRADMKTCFAQLHSAALLTQAT